MDKIAFVFSGQGAQYPGMGKELYEVSPAARAVFDCAESICPGTRKQCFEGTQEELSVTINTQPCMFCMDLAAAQAVRELGIMPDAVAGFSLGEVAALTFAQAFDLETGFKLVCKRAALMQEAAEKHEGAMVAVLKLSGEEVQKLCAGRESTYPVNYNSSAQTVVALAKSELEGFCAAVKQQGGRAVPLAVSGGFHSPFMEEAAEGLLRELQSVDVKKPVLPVYANSTAKPYEDEIRTVLAAQVNHPVYWQNTIENMAADGITVFIEVGAGKTLSGLTKKIIPDARILNVEDRAGLQALAAIKEELC